MLHMFRTLLVHHQEQLYKLYMPIRVATATQQPDLWYRHIPNAMYSLKNVAPDDGLNT